MMMWHIIIGLLGLFIISNSVGQTVTQAKEPLSSANPAEECDNPSQPQRGYWWYKECKTVDNSEDNKTKSPAAIPDTSSYPKQLPPLPSKQEMLEMHPQQIKQLLNQRHEHAVYVMTPEATHDYLTVLDIARRKAKSVTSLAQFVLLQHPELNPAAKNSLTTPAKNADTMQREKEQELKFATQREKYGLVILIDPSCKYCDIQINTLKRFAQKHNWEVGIVDVTVHPHAVVKYNTDITPHTILVKRNSKVFQTVAIGAQSLTSIEKSVYRAIRYLEQETNARQYFITESDDGGYFDPEFD
jgi:conjugal transfer pilus assembly protein TraF